MNTQRAVSVAFAVAAAVMLATSSLGYSAVNAERGVRVEVVESEDAYVGVTVCRPGDSGGGSSDPVHVRVVNQYSDSFTVVDVTSDAGDSLPPGQQHERLDPGDSETFEPLRADDEVTVHVAGSVTATVNASVGSPNCPLQPPSGGSQSTATGGS